MERISIISTEDPKGGFVGWPKGRPDIVAEGDTYPDLVKNVISLMKTVQEYENKNKKEKN